MFLNKNTNVSKAFSFATFCCLLAGYVTNDVNAAGPPEGPAPTVKTQSVTINSALFRVSAEYTFFTWNTLPSDVQYQRQQVQSFTDNSGTTHYYETVYLLSGNLNWFQAAYLVQEAGGYLVSITSSEENSFVFSMVSDEKYFWKFPKIDGRQGHMNHHEISIGPFIGGYQPEGSTEPAGSWSWLSGKKME